jgi:phosphatidylglycerol phospholipase C
MSPAEARRFFWDSVHGFSVYYEALATPDGQKFLAECRSHGKGVCAWTVNTREGMRECVRWGLGSCITDKPDIWREVKAEVSFLFYRVVNEADEQFQNDYYRAVKPTLQTYLLPFVNKKAWWFDIAKQTKEERQYLEKEGGKFEGWEGFKVGLQIARAE